MPLFLNFYLNILVCNCNFQFKECGLVFAGTNLKIVGGIDAVAHSWPSLAYVEFNYKFRIQTANHRPRTYPFRSTCGGTLIGRDTVLTAAHCLPNHFTLNDDDFGSVTIDIKPNSFYPSYESMLTIFLGLQNPGTRRNKYDQARQIIYASKIIIVREFFNVCTKINKINFHI